MEWNAEASGEVAQRSGAALRYAEAIFQVARDSQSYDLWLRELGEVETLLSDPFAAQVLLSPAIPRDRKAAILAEAVPELGEPVRRFLELLLRRDRVELLPQVLESFRELVDRELGVQVARVTTALPLRQADRDLVAMRLSSYTGKRIRLEESVDPSIIGGVIAQIGDEILDGSVRGRLDRLRRALVGS
jgi:F-type H+-transporting ATPase subunit delta